MIIILNRAKIAVQLTLFLVSDNGDDDDDL